MNYRRNPDLVEGRQEHLWIDWLSIGALCVAMVVFYCLAATRISVVIDGRHYPTLFDDTYISMRYARHLANGHGLVWNIGEPPIEGFTNFLWVLWMALLTLLRQDPSYLVLASGAVLHVLSVVLFFGFLRRRVGVSRGSGLAAALLLASWKPIVEQVLNGLEGALLLFAFVAALGLLYGTIRQRTRLYGCLVAGLLPVIRPDGAFLLLILFGGLALQVVSESGKSVRAATRRLLIFAVIMLGPLAILTIFRFAYFGDILPNTYYLKVARRPGRFEFGSHYVARFLRDFAGTPLLIPLVIYSVVQSRQWMKALGPGIVLILAYIAYQGGDAWDWWRFMIPVLPLFLILLGSALRRVSGWITMTVWICIFAFSVPLPLKRHDHESLLPRASAEVADNIRTGLLLRKLCSPNCVTADFWAGAVPYYSNLPSIDVLGKSDRHIAHLPAYKPGAPPGHDKFDFAYVLKREPDVIVSTMRSDIKGRLLGPVRRSIYPFGAYLIDHPAFAASYEPVYSVLSNRWHGIFVRKGAHCLDLEKLPTAELRILDEPLALIFGSGWYGIERGPHSWWRWAGTRAELRVFSMSAVDVVLTGEVRTASRNDIITISCDSDRLAQIEPPDGRFHPFGPCHLRLQPGETIIQIQASNTPTVPPGDDRKLGFCVRDLRLSAQNGVELAPADL